MARFERKPSKLPEVGSLMLSSGLFGKSGVEYVNNHQLQQQQLQNSESKDKAEKSEKEKEKIIQKTSKKNSRRHSTENIQKRKEEHVNSRNRNSDSTDEESDDSDSEDKLRREEREQKERINSEQSTTPKIRSQRDLLPLKQRNTHTSNTMSSSTSMNNMSHNIPHTLIPPQYHKKELSPILPAVSSPQSKGDQPEQLEYKDKVWYRTWFPSNKPKDRREVIQLANTFEEMMNEIQNMDQITVSQIDKEQKVYDIILNEIIRQVYVECADRGIILEKVSNRYRELFSRVPDLLSSMKTERDNLVESNRSLSILLEKLIEEKNGLETLLQLKMDQLESLERKHEVLTKQTDELQIKSKYLTEEKDIASQETKRYQESFRIQENLHRQQQSKELEAQQTIAMLTKQLETALTKLHQYEVEPEKLKKMAQESQSQSNPASS